MDEQGMSGNRWEQPRAEQPAPTQPMAATPLEPVAQTPAASRPRPRRWRWLARTPLVLAAVAVAMFLGGGAVGFAIGHGTAGGQGPQQGQFGPGGSEGPGQGGFGGRGFDHRRFGNQGGGEGGFGQDDQGGQGATDGSAQPGVDS